jgi:hypothetical protein
MASSSRPAPRCSEPSPISPTTTPNPGEGWSPYSRPGNVADLLAEVRDHVERLEEAVKKARRQLAAVERPARLAAYRRAKAEEVGR